MPIPVATDPGRTLGVVGLVLSVTNGFALAGVVVGGVVTLAWLIGGVALGHVASVGKDLGPGTHQVDGVTCTCG